MLGEQKRRVRDMMIVYCTSHVVCSGLRPLNGCAAVSLWGGEQTRQRLLVGRWVQRVTPVHSIPRSRGWVGAGVGVASDFRLKYFCL